MSDDRRPPEDTTSNSDDPEGEIPLPHHRRPSRRALTIALAPIVLISVLGTIANWFFRAYLTAEHPVLLLLADPRALNMLLVETRIDDFTYYAVVLFRRLFADPSYFLLGFWYGVAALSWMKKQSPGLGDLAVKFEEWFPRFGWLLMLVYPHPLVMVIAGISAMRFRTFIALDAIGTIALAIAIRVAGDFVEPQVKAVNGFISDYWIQLTVGSIALFVLLSFFSGRKEEGKGAGGFRSIGDMQRELDEESGDPLDRPRHPRQDDDLR